MTGKWSHGGSPKGSIKSENEYQSFLKKSKSTIEMSAYSSAIANSSPLRGGSDGTSSQPSTPNFGHMRPRSQMTLQKPRQVTFSGDVEKNEDEPEVLDIPSSPEGTVFVASSDEGQENRQPTPKACSDAVENTKAQMRPSDSSPVSSYWVGLLRCACYLYYALSALLVVLQVFRLCRPSWWFWESRGHVGLVIVLFWINISGIGVFNVILSLSDLVRTVLWLIRLYKKKTTIQFKSRTVIILYLASISLFALNGLNCAGFFYYFCKGLRRRNAFSIILKGSLANRTVIKMLCYLCASLASHALMVGFSDSDYQEMKQPPIKDV